MMKAELEETQVILKNEKVEKERQNLKYREVLKEYKKLNEELTEQLQEREKKEVR